MDDQTYDRSVLVSLTGSLQVLTLKQFCVIDDFGWLALCVGKVVYKVCYVIFYCIGPKLSHILGEGGPPLLTFCLIMQ